jgi:hypothetical protein
MGRTEEEARPRLVSGGTRRVWSWSYPGRDWTAQLLQLPVVLTACLNHQAPRWPLLFLPAKRKRHPRCPYPPWRLPPILNRIHPSQQKPLRRPNFCQYRLHLTCQAAYWRNALSESEVALHSTPLASSVLASGSCRGALSPWLRGASYASLRWPTNCMRSLIKQVPNMFSHFGFDALLFRITVMSLSCWMLGFSFTTTLV